MSGDILESEPGQEQDRIARDDSHPRHTGLETKATFRESTLASIAKGIDVGVHIDLVMEKDMEETSVHTMTTIDVGEDRIHLTTAIAIPIDERFMFMLHPIDSHIRQSDISIQSTYHSNDTSAYNVIHCCLLCPHTFILIKCCMVDIICPTQTNKSNITSLVARQIKYPRSKVTPIRIDALRSSETEAFV